MSTSAQRLPALGGVLPIARLRSLFRTEDVEKRLHKLPPREHESLRSTYERMLERGPERFQVKPGGLPAMDHLYDELPNFHEVLDDLKRQLALCQDSQDALELTPMLLLGPPGVGKTHFAREVARLLGTGMGFVSMSSLTAGWVLSGASSQWKGARPGKVFETLIDGPYANPVMVVDEIDKASTDGQYDPLGALYGLLEPDTAAEFVDEFAEVPVDCSDIVWVATANDIGRIPDPILNRMNVYEIPAPDRDGARRIAQGLYREIRDSHEWGARFPEQLADVVADRLARCAPREMRRQLVGAFGSAKLAGRSEIELHDLSSERSPRRARMGF